MALNDKIIYIVATYASKVRVLEELVEQLSKISHRIIITATPNATPILNGLSITLPSNAEVRLEGVMLGDKTTLPEPSVVLVAPASFNTVSKLALGIADSYALTVVATALASSIPVIVAPSYDTLWNHPLNMDYITRLQTMGVRVVFPDLERSHITMAPVTKLVDMYRTQFGKVKFETKELSPKLGFNKQLKHMRELYGESIIRIGKELENEGLNFSVNGCLSVREGDWVLITTTGSRLARLKEDDLSLVSVSKSLSEKAIYWYGTKIPSSETPLHLMLYDRMPWVGSVAHTHAPSITYNSKYAQFKTKEYVPYGEFEHVDEVLELVEKHGFGIMRLHGEVAVAENLQAINHKLKSYLTESGPYG